MRSNGFTLIEVLIALAILSIALTAMIKSTSENIKHTRYLHDKTIANWVATTVINETRLGILKLPTEPLEDETEMLGQSWPWKASLNETPNLHIKKIKVDVYSKSTHSRLIHLESYFYVK